jgi:hypothetical protein
MRARRRREIEKWLRRKYRRRAYHRAWYAGHREQRRTFGRFNMWRRRARAMGIDV